MHILNEQTRETLSRKLGKTYDEILQMSAEELDALVEARIGKKLTPAFSLKKMVSRGDVYFFFKRLARILSAVASGIISIVLADLF